MRWKHTSRIILAVALFGFVATAAPVNHDGRIAPAPRQKESVRAELARLQEQTGLSLLLWENYEIQSVDFGRRTFSKVRKLPNIGMGAISPDGTRIAFGIAIPTHLGVSRTDGSELREYRYLAMPDQMCWSPDKSILAMRAMDQRNDTSYGLILMNLETETTQAVDSHGSLTSQCWSPNGKQLVYEADGNLAVFDVQGSHANVLCKGTDPTWSPDGNWIAFLDHDTYYAIRPSGTERKKLFHKWGAHSGLLWSPDSRIVAYVSQAGLLEGGFSLDVESYWLRVRRLEDGSEDRVVGFGGSRYEWVAKFSN